MESMTGRLLVATPALKDPNFDRTVVMLVAHEPSGPAWVVPIWLKSVFERAYSMLSVAPAGEEPSAKRSWPETATGFAPRWLEALTVIAETGTAKWAARARRSGSCA